jgi:hypothetical protein
MMITGFLFITPFVRHSRIDNIIQLVTLRKGHRLYLIQHFDTNSNQ